MRAFFFGFTFIFGCNPFHQHRSSLPRCKHTTLFEYTPCSFYSSNNEITTLLLQVYKATISHGSLGNIAITAAIKTLKTHDSNARAELLREAALMVSHANKDSAARGHFPPDSFLIIATPSQRQHIGSTLQHAQTCFSTPGPSLAIRRHFSITQTWCHFLVSSLCHETCQLFLCSNSARTVRGARCNLRLYTPCYTYATANNAQKLIPCSKFAKALNRIIERNDACIASCSTWHIALDTRARLACAF